MTADSLCALKKIRRRGKAVRGNGRAGPRENPCEYPSSGFRRARLWSETPHNRDWLKRGAGAVCASSTQTVTALGKRGEAYSPKGEAGRLRGASPWERSEAFAEQTPRGKPAQRVGLLLRWSGWKWKEPCPAGEPERRRRAAAISGGGLWRIRHSPQQERRLAAGTGSRERREHGRRTPAERGKTMPRHGGSGGKRAIRNQSFVAVFSNQKDHLRQAPLRAPPGAADAATRPPPSCGG